ncbi:MAG: PorT family protein [Bacteroidales bacterium]|nr:PorT family protein [Bacteroidales bacterium]
MKRLGIALAVAALAFGVNMSAQHFDNTRFGITAGVTSSSSKIKNVDTKSISLFHAGVALEAPLGGGFAIQPEILYQVKGLSLDKWGDSTGNQIAEGFQTKVGFVEVPVQIQWGPDLVAFRPYGFVEPFIGYQISSNGKGEAKSLSKELQKMEYGLSLGAGLDFSHIQLSAKYFWNFGSVYQSDVAKTGSTIGGILDGNNFNGFAISAAFFF